MAVSIFIPVLRSLQLWAMGKKTTVQACPGASCLLPHLLIEGCGHVTFKLCMSKVSALVNCYKYGLH